MTFLKCALLLFVAQLSLADPITVQTSKGPVFGYTYNAFDQHNVLFHGMGHAFQGIPFAKPPVGERRLKLAEEPDAWTEPLNATYFRPQCPQSPGSPFAPMSEDCLYLNVYTPVNAPPANQPYAVMVWIYGGSFVHGSADFYPTAGIITNFIQRDVVVVTLNYRLGLLGQFTTITDDFPANLGLHDQLLALKWVNKEIGNFGGDVTRVTLFGQSAGGCSVSYHTYSPLSRNLFQRAIVESGPALVCMDGVLGGFHHSSQQAALDLCGIDSDHWNGGDYAGLRQCLATKRADDIVKYQKGKQWLPTVDGPGGFLPAFPRDLASQRPNVPVLMGTTRDEAISFTPWLGAPPAVVNTIDERAYFAVLTLIIVTENEFGNYTMAVRDAVDQEYRVKANLSADDHMGWLKLIIRVCTTPPLPYRGELQMATDRTFVSLTSLAAQRWNETANRDVYVYSFEYASDAIPFLNTAGHKFVPHSAELAYVFIFARVFNVSALTTRDTNMMHYFADWWTNFAKTGRPTSAASAHDWQPLDAAHPDRYLHIGGEHVQMMPHYAAQASHFWNVVVPQIMGNSVGPTFGPNVTQTPVTTTASTTTAPTTTSTQTTTTTTATRKPPSTASTTKPPSTTSTTKPPSTASTPVAVPPTTPTTKAATGVQHSIAALFAAVILVVHQLL